MNFVLPVIFARFFLANLISVLSEMIPKEIMKRGGILSRLAQFKEESPYKPEIQCLCVSSRLRISFALIFAPKILARIKAIRIHLGKTPSVRVSPREPPEDLKQQ